MTTLGWIGDYSSIKQNGDLTYLNESLNRMSLDDVLKWAYKHSEGRLLPVTSFGPSGLVILHRMKHLGILKRVVTIDTLHLFPETYDFIKKWKVNEGIGVQILIYKPLNFNDLQSFDYIFGNNLYKTDPDKYAFLSKVEPLRRALIENNPKIWITGRRQSQGGERSELQILEWDQQHRLKLNPLKNWSMEQVWDYIKKHNIPYNSLHDQGYTSIGDTMTTIRPLEGEGERSGRFFGLAQTECGCNKL